VGVSVVVDANVCLAFVGAHEPSGVLDEPALERDREGEEEGVELWAVEAFAEVLAGRDDDEFVCGRAVLDLLDDRGAGAFGQAPFQNEWWDPSLGKLVGEPVAVLLQLLRTRHRRPSLRAAITSSQTSAVRPSSSTRVRNTSWIGVSPAPEIWRSVS
jgi:hypothetical protein